MILVNSLWVTFLNVRELICLHSEKYFQVLLSNTNSSICTQLNGFKVGMLVGFYGVLTVVCYLMPNPIHDL